MKDDAQIDSRLAIDGSIVTAYKLIRDCKWEHCNCIWLVTTYKLIQKLEGH